MRTFELFDNKTGEMTFCGVEVTETNPCPICGGMHSKQSWCLIDAPRGLVICPRVKSDKEIGAAGWLHSIDSNGGEVVTRTKTEQDVRNFIQEAKSYHGALQRSQQKIDKLSVLLGVTSQTILDFGVGIDQTAWTFPMWSPNKVCTGIRKRGFSGGKWSETGSAAGLFHALKRNRKHDWLLVCEGESDALVAHELGFDVIGIPGARQAEKMVSSTAFKRQTVVIADNDEIGLEASRKLVKKLKDMNYQVCLVRPPVAFKDLRSWYNQRKFDSQSIESLVRQKTSWTRPSLSSAS